LLSGFRKSKSQQGSASRGDERELIQRCKDGDIGAFNELVTLFEKRVFNFAYRISGNYDDANDVAQEAFIRVFNSLHSFRGDSNFSTWVYRIVKNVYLDERKKSKSHRLTSLDDYIELEENPVAKQVEDRGPSPEQIVEQNELARVLQEAICKLPDYQRVIVTLYHMQHKSYDEIADILGLPIGTVKSRLNRARLALAEILQEETELFQQTASQDIGSSS